MKREIRTFRDLDELSAYAAKHVCDLIDNVVRMKGTFNIALSGGSTPRLLYRLLATAHSVPWESVHFFWGDERYVPHGEEESNYHMAKVTLLDLVPVPAANVHPIPTDCPSPEEAARIYEKELQKSIPDSGNSFDLVLLGLGKEGHTASLFPNSWALDEKERWAVAVDLSAVPHRRITLTFPILNRADAVCFLVSGREKAEALSRIVDDVSDFHAYPAKRIQPSSGKLVFLVDSAAARG